MATSATTVAHAAVAAPGAIGVRLVDEAGADRNDPRARLYIVDRVAPGNTLHRRIEVSNTTASTAHVSLYAAAASIVGGVFTGAPAHTVNDLSTWTSVAPGVIDVPTGQVVTAAVTIAPPSDAAPGEQYGAVWAEVSSSPNGGSGVTEISRVGVRLYVSVGPGGAPASDFTIDSLTARRSPDGRPEVVAAVHNTGGRALDMSGSLELANGPGGLSAGPYPATVGVTLAVGATEPVVIALDKRVPSGPWDARITLRSGLVERDTSARISFPAAGGPARTAGVSKHAGSGRPPLAIAVSGALVLLAATVATVRWRMRQRKVTSS